VSVRLGGGDVLRSLDLDVAPGERVALVGPSGAGKTTLLRVLNGVVRPSSGEVLAGGRDLAALDRREVRLARAAVGFVHQDHSLVPNLRVWQNVVSGKLGRRGMFASLRSMTFPPSEDLDLAWTILDRVGIGDKLYQRTDTLSGGEQQRVAIARALFQEPRALLADEPVASVDPARARDVMELLTGLAEERGLTLIASLHDLGLARACFPRVVGLRDGYKVLDAASDALDADDFDALYALPGRDA